MYKFDVVGIGNPILDKMVRVTDEHLTLLGKTKGAMHLVDEGESRELLGWIKSQNLSPNNSPGGSCCNTTVGLAHLGASAAYIGAIGKDKNGEIMEKDLRTHGVEPLLLKRDVSTGTSIILITPDAERTMNTHLGAARELSPEDISGDLLLRSKYLHLEGYLWDSPEQAKAARKAIDICRMGKVKVSLDLSDLFVVERYGDEFWQLLKDGKIDIVFANEDEAEHFTGKDAYGSVKLLGEYCEYAVVKQGSTGSLIFTEGQLYDIPPHKVRAVDSTGAGDMYAACTLYGLTQNMEPQEIGVLASLACGKVVTQQGAHLDHKLRKEVVQTLSN